MNGLEYSLHELGIEPVLGSPGIGLGEHLLPSAGLDYCHVMGLLDFTYMRAHLHSCGEFAYQVFVYYRGFGERYDHLLSVTVIASNKK